LEEFKGEKGKLFSLKKSKRFSLLLKARKSTVNYAKYMIYSDMHLTKSKKKILGEVHCTCRKYYTIIAFVWGRYMVISTKQKYIDWGRSPRSIYFCWSI